MESMGTLPDTLYKKARCSSVMRSPMPLIMTMSQRRNCFRLSSPTSLMRMKRLLLLFEICPNVVIW